MRIQTTRLLRWEVIRVTTLSDALYLVGLVVLWFTTYQAACWLVALIHSKTLVCWSVGPFGVSAVHWREPAPGLLLIQVTLPGLAVACVGYASLYAVYAGWSAALTSLSVARVGVAAALGVVASALQVLRILADRRFPLWGEARVLAFVQRSRALGSLIHFTPTGRAFLRERFDATPREFLQAVN
jgi:hypothetical protein